MSKEKELILEAKHVTKKFPLTKGKELIANDDVSLKFYKGQTLGIVGESGCGKSTFMRMMVQLEQPTSGEILFKGKDITQETADKRANEGMFLSFQEPLEVPGLTVSAFIRNALQQRKGSYIKLWDFKKELDKNLKFLDMDPAYSERSLNPMAAKIVAEETDKMMIATKQLFYAMEVHKLLHFTNPDMSAVSFAMTIHGLMDYELDQSNGKCSYETDKNLLDDYLKWFCEENAI